MRKFDFRFRHKKKNTVDAQAFVKRKLHDEYGSRIEVSFSKTILETSVMDGPKLWVVEGDAKIRNWLFWKKTCLLRTS
jgi:hypothetical protein